MTHKLTTNQARVQSWAIEKGLSGKLGELTGDQLKAAAADLSLPIDKIAETVLQLQKTGFSDARQAQNDRLLNGDLSAATVTSVPQRDVFGGSIENNNKAVDAFKQMVSLNNEVVSGRPWDRPTRHQAQAAVRDVFKHDLTPAQQKEARLWMASEGGGWALDAVSRGGVHHFLDAIWSNIMQTDYSRAPAD